jgi:hypothetical protein
MLYIKKVIFHKMGSGIHKVIAVVHEMNWRGTLRRGREGKGKWRKWGNGGNK